MKNYLLINSTDIEKVSGASKEWLLNTFKRGETGKPQNRILICCNSDSVSINVLKLTSSLNVDFVVGNDLTIGFTIGMTILNDVISGGDKDVHLYIKLGKDIDTSFASDIGNVGVTVHTTLPTNKTEAPKQRKRRTKEEVKAETKPIKEAIEEDLPFPEKSAPVKVYKTAFLSKSKNPEIKKILSDASSKEKLVKAVKDSSDPKIGLEQLLNIYFGKDTTPLIIDEIRKDYNLIKEA